MQQADYPPGQPPVPPTWAVPTTCPSARPLTAIPGHGATGTAPGLCSRRPCRRGHLL